MKNVNPGVEAIRRFQVLFNDLAGLADSLEGVSSLQGMADAARQQLDKTSAELKAAQTELEGVTAMVADAKADAAAIVHAAQKVASDVTARAEKAAKDARAIADGLEPAVAERSRIDGEIAAMKAALEALKAERRSVSADLASKQSALDAVNAAIAALRS